ncbi:hypothetical protein [Terriglobus albidus]|uniref:hypothetical protein n=1 Tax=Terriglobus albidus TaxID=1592106 RepID=UPI0021E0E2AF|nr:hypothetical protein [Terriglobus albidus]
MEISLPHFPDPIAFRFFADFDIQIQPKEMAEFTMRQKILLQAIASSPPTLRRIARMALETDLSGITGEHLSELFEGPSSEEILECVLPCLSDVDKAYWSGLGDGLDDDPRHDEIVSVFLTFKVTLRRAGLEELSAGPELIKKNVGPTLDARNL